MFIPFVQEFPSLLQCVVELQYYPRTQIPSMPAYSAVRLINPFFLRALRAFVVNIFVFT